MRYIIPLTSVKVSTNKIYAGIHWSRRKEIKDSIYQLTKWFCRPIQEVKSYPVEISYQFFYRIKPLDTLNNAFMAKCIEDSLVSLGAIKDDSPRYVKKASIEVSSFSPPEEKKERDAQSQEAYEENEDCFVIININKIKS